MLDSVLYQDMRRAKALGQYFTPAPVVELCYRMLLALGPRIKTPRMIDPACGEGAFLAYALEHQLTSPDSLFGVERDPEIAALWKKRGLAGRAKLFVRDGLLPDDAFPDESFDWVVGNPPFGTQGLRSAPSSRRLLSAVADGFTIWRQAGRKSADLARYPIEILFLERLWQLAKPGGYVAVVVPDGVLANARLSYVREWLSRCAVVKALVSLPQHTFGRSGASAKASVLVFRKGASAEEPVFMAALESRGPLRRGVEPLASVFADFLAGNRSGDSCPPWLTSAVETPSRGARLDPAYYHPRYLDNARALRAMPDVVPLGELIEYTTYGQVGAREYAASGVRLLTPANLVRTSDGFVTGVDVRSPERFVAPGSRNDPARSRLWKGDLLLANSGVGCIGRSAVFRSDEPCNISQHINLVRLNGIEPEFIAVYLQTRFARLQIHREKCGVGACGINFDRIKSILVPVLPERSRAAITEGYRGMSRDPAASGEPIRKLVERLEEFVLQERV